ncbi:hypothetical protein B7P43_G12918 [Cryptotermes secundus]|uniref:CCHC-type domain-containing protein n=1 Tax=Cryptotermes secundus TaxID=105785 RepID=A0A2J7Q8E3_9NEOP|nr:hypothetical protein B7P43_G12918 [Cryptotermes secundus]
MALMVSRTSGRITQILGAHIGTTQSWGLVQTEIISTFLPCRVKERFLASHVLEGFQSPGEDLNSYVMSVVAAADILGFSGSEAQLVQRMLQNLHPKVKSYLLFATRPESIKDLFSLATTVAEAVAVENQRKRTTASAQQGCVSQPVASGMVIGQTPAAKADSRRRCWGCGAPGHNFRDCPSRPHQRRATGSSGNDLGVRSRVPNLSPPRRVFFPRDSRPSPFVTVRIGDFCLPAMLDSGSSRSFIRRDVLDTIKGWNLPYTVETTEERCLMANGESCVLSWVCVLGIRLHSFS